VHFFGLHCILVGNAAYWRSEGRISKPGKLKFILAKS